jgi:hypothetical protein
VARPAGPKLMFEPDVSISVRLIIDPHSATNGDREVFVLPPDQKRWAMEDSSYYRERAETALRLARDTTDPHLIKTLRAFAAECNAKADAIDARASWAKTRRTSSRFRWMELLILVSAAGLTIQTAQT